MERINHCVERNDLCVERNDFLWNETTMERNDRNSQHQSAKGIKRNILIVLQQLNIHFELLTLAFQTENEAMSFNEKSLFI